MGAISSMTGYGRAEARGERVAAVAEARSVNHRFLDINIKVPRGLAVLEGDLRRLIQGRAARGRFDVSVTTQRTKVSGAEVRTDAALALRYVREARVLRDATGVTGDVTLADLLRAPGVFSVEEGDEPEAETGPGGLPSEVLVIRAAVESAVETLARMRLTEGLALAEELASQVGLLAAWVDEVEALLPVALRRIQDRMRERIEALLRETPVDPGRLAQEVATWAAKSDVAEELARLRSHCAQARTLLADGGAVGRQLDFLAQELHREVNTIASKADDQELVARALQARTLVERIREQVQNVE
jgi:uncharacterized protein (TIGR00255 family)